MATTNLHIDDKLLAEALRLGGHRTKREAVNEALKEYVRHREQRKIIELFGTLEDDAFWDAPALPAKSEKPPRGKRKSA